MPALDFLAVKRRDVALARALGTPPEALNDPEKNIDAGTLLIKRIGDRVKNPTAAKINSTPEQRKRVLWEIFEWCRMYRAVAAPGDPYETYRRDGMRSVGLRILGVMHEEPEERPTRAISELGE